MSSIGRAVKELVGSFQIADLVAVLALGLGLFWLIFIRSFGLAFTPDSIQYMSYAMKLRYASEFSLTPFWPPMYPILINLAMYANGFPAEAAALLSGLTMILFLFVFTSTLRNYSDDFILIGLFLITLFTFDRFLHSYKFALSEASFSLFLLLNFYFVIKHYETKREFLFCDQALRDKAIKVLRLRRVVHLAGSSHPIPGLWVDCHLLRLHALFLIRQPR
jgi:hypothetical protein